MCKRALALITLGFTSQGCGASPTTAAGTGAQVGALPREGCEPLGVGPSGPVLDPNGPYYHQVVLARTVDGVTLTDARQILEHASVPDGVRLGDGSLRAYYVNGAEGCVWVARVEGETVTPIGPISLDGIVSPQGVVDPDALLLSDGRIRLFYLGGFGPPNSSQTRGICIADSSDGQRFSIVGRAIRFQDQELVTDPSVTPLRDGSWFMAVSRGQQTVTARSADGLAFTAESTLSVGGVPEVSALPDGRLRLYVCAGGIESYASGDSGRTWQREATVVRPGTGGAKIVCDPSAVAGSDAFLYKTAQ